MKQGIASPSASLERVPNVEAERVTDLLAKTRRTEGPACARAEPESRMTCRRRCGGRRAKAGEPSTALEVRGCVRGRRGRYEAE